MRLSKTVGLIVVVVIIAVALGVLFSIYSGQIAERNELDERLSKAQTLLPGLVQQREDLEDQLTQAESLLEKSEAEFPESVDSIQYDDDLFRIADDCNVQLTRVRFSEPKNTKQGGVTYSVSSVTMTVKGSIDDILEFIYAIRIGEGFELPWSADVNGIKMDFGSTEAVIELDIYGYKR